MTAVPYFVSRQSAWPQGSLYVEVACGGLDYANPDMLAVGYRSLGEGNEYHDPREAVDAAIAICRAWRRDHRGVRIDVRVGHTMGFTAPFEPGTFRQALAWARDVAERLPSCAHCGELLERLTYRHALAEDGERFCSEYCADEGYAGYLHGACDPS